VRDSNNPQHHLHAADSNSLETHATDDSASTRSVLIVDDEPAVGAALTVRLQAVGFSSRCATSGAQGLTEARRSKPGAIILDVRMPEMDGIEMCTILRADPIISDIPVVFLSASTLTPGTLRTLHSLGDAFLAKPYDAPELLRILESFMPTPANLGLAPTRKRPARPILLDDAAVSTSTATTQSSNVPALLAPTGRTAVATDDSDASPNSPVEINPCQPSTPAG
jgi:CheY-like chemotaxis protein